MRKILRARQTGRTDELIKLCAEDEARGEVCYIVCMDQQEASRIFQRSQELELNIGFPVTFDEFLDHQYAARNIHHFYIDNADYLLRVLSKVDIRAITMEEG